MSARDDLLDALAMAIYQERSKGWGTSWQDFCVSWPEEAEEYRTHAVAYLDAIAAHLESLGPNMLLRADGTPVVAERWERIWPDEWSYNLVPVDGA